MPRTFPTVLQTASLPEASGTMPGVTRNQRTDEVLPTEGPLLISVKRAAQLLSISEATFWRWVKHRPNFPRPLKISPGCTRLRHRELMEFIESLEAGQ